MIYYWIYKNILHLLKFSFKFFNFSEKEKCNYNSNIIALFDIISINKYILIIHNYNLKILNMKFNNKYFLNL